FLRRARRFSNEPAVADGARSLTYGELAARVVAVARELSSQLAAKDSEPAVAVMLPPSIEAAQANLAIAALGRVVVNFDYTADRQEMPAALARARAGAILTTRAFARRQGLRPWPGARVLFIDDMVSGASGASLR